MTTTLTRTPAPAPVTVAPPPPPRRRWFLRTLAAGCATVAMPFGAPVHPHTVARLLRPERPR